MDSKIPTEKQNLNFIKACKNSDYNMVEYYLYYYQVNFLEGYLLGNRIVKNLIKRDVRRRYFVKIILKKVPIVEYFKRVDGREIFIIHDINCLYSEEDIFSAICHCELFGRNNKISNYLIIKTITIFLYEKKNTKSKAPIKRLPYELIRYITDFF